MRLITKESELRELLGKPHPLTVSKINQQLDDAAADFISKAPLLFMATVDAEGQTTVSPKGDAPGFVKIVDNNTLLIPERPGNKLLHGLGNILQTGRIGLVFLIPGTDETLRVNGRCKLFHDDERCREFTANGKAALLLLKVEVDQVFFHCGKAFKRSKAWEPDGWLERQKISFGKQIARGKLGKEDGVAGKALAAIVDQAVKSDYKHNL